MEIVVVLAVLVLALVVWRAVRRGRPSRPIDSGHPHLTDVDPHSPDER